jgi:hypothetical protein
LKSPSSGKESAAPEYRKGVRKKESKKMTVDIKILPLQLSGYSKKDKVTMSNPPTATLQEGSAGAASHYPLRAE